MSRKTFRQGLSNFGVVILITLFSVVPVSAQEQDSSEGWQNDAARAQFDALIAEGRSALENQQFRESAALFDEALQLVKIWEGLYAPVQLPALLGLTQSTIANRNWRSANQYLSYFAYLNEKSRIYGIDYYLVATEMLADLYLFAAADPLNPNSAHHLVAAKNSSWLAINTIENYLGENSLRLPPWLYRISLSHLYQSRLTERRGLTSYDYKSEEREIVSGWMLDLNESRRISYNIGKELLQRIADIYIANNAGVELQALAQVQLGDWETLFYQDEYALRNYHRAYELMQEAGSPRAGLDKLFARASILPEPVLLQSFDAEGSSPPLRYSGWSSVFPGVPTPQSRNLGFYRYTRDSSVSLRLDYGRENPDISWESAALGPHNVVFRGIDGDAATDYRAELDALRLRPFMAKGEPGNHENLELQLILGGAEVELP